MPAKFLYLELSTLIFVVESGFMPTALRVSASFSLRWTRTRARQWAACRSSLLSRAKRLGLRSCCDKREAGLRHTFDHETARKHCKSPVIEELECNPQACRSGSSWTCLPGLTLWAVVTWRPLSALRVINVAPCQK